MIGRTEILKKANECVTGSRQQDYGEVEDNFGRIAKLWSAYTGHEYTSLDVAMMLGLVKVGRAASGRLHIDNFIDLAGYAACAGEIAGRMGNNVHD